MRTLVLERKAKELPPRCWTPKSLVPIFFSGASFIVLKMVILTLMSCSDLIQATPIDVVLPFFSRICCPQQYNSFKCCLGNLRTQQGICLTVWMKTGRTQAAEVVCLLLCTDLPLVNTQWHQVGFMILWCVAKPSRWPLLVIKLLFILKLNHYIYLS